MTYQRKFRTPRHERLPRGESHKGLIYLGLDFVTDKKGNRIRVATFATDYRNQGMRLPTGNREAARHARQQSR